MRCSRPGVPGTAHGRASGVDARAIGSDRPIHYRAGVASEFELSKEAEMIHNTGKMAKMINNTATTSRMPTLKRRWNFCEWVRPVL